MAYIKAPARYEIERTARFGSPFIVWKAWTEADDDKPYKRDFASEQSFSNFLIERYGVRYAKQVLKQKNPKGASRKPATKRKRVARRANSPFLSFPSRTLASDFVKAAKAAGHSNIHVASVKGKTGVFLGNMSHVEAEQLKNELNRRFPKAALTVNPKGSKRKKSMRKNPDLVTAGQFLIHKAGAVYIGAPDNFTARYRLPDRRVVSITSDGWSVTAGSDFPDKSGRDFASLVDWIKNEPSRQAAREIAAQERAAKAKEDIRKGKFDAKLQKIVDTIAHGMEAASGKASTVRQASTLDGHLIIENDGVKVEVDPTTHELYAYQHKIVRGKSLATLTKALAKYGEWEEPKKKNPSFKSLISSAKRGLRKLTPRGRRASKAMKRLTDFGKPQGLSAQGRKSPHVKRLLAAKNPKGSKARKRAKRNPGLVADLVQKLKTRGLPAFGYDSAAERMLKRFFSAYPDDAGRVSLSEIADLIAAVYKANGNTRFDASVGEALQYAISANEIPAGWAGLKFQIRHADAKDRHGRPLYFPARAAQVLEAAGKQANPKRNPEASASALFQRFHGTPSTSILEVTERMHVHENLAQLGTLTELKVLLNPTQARSAQRLVTLKASGGASTHKDSKAVHLTSSEDGLSLYFTGGDQKLDVKALGFSGSEIKDLMVIGELQEVTYRTQKNFDKFKTLDYYHGVGEENGKKPFLLYKPRDKQMLSAGGDYRVRPEGIVN